MTTPQNPGNSKIAIYVRPTTQQNRASSQTDNLLAFARSLGWKDEQITVFEEQPTLRALVKGVLHGSITTILVSHEDRLFRDQTSIPAEAFLRLCEEQQVTVITPHTVYDCSN